MKIKEKIRKVRIKNRKGARFRKGGADKGDAAPAAGSFAATAQPGDPILRLKVENGKRPAAWQNGLISSISLAAMLTALLSLFCMSIDSPALILFALPCPIVFMAVAVTGSALPGKARWIAAGAAAAILLIAAIIWHSEIFGGISMLVNSFYDTAEEAQAYLYDRLPDIDGGSGGAGMAWLSALAGLLAALPQARFRRTISGLLAIIAMLAFAYYGLLPSAICVAVMIAALMIAASRGSLLSILPVMLAALLLFGAVVLADPGENYGISRIDENFRDKFALKSALIETTESFDDDFDDEEDEEDYEDEEDDEDYEDEEDADYSSYVIYGLLALVIAAGGAAAFVTCRRISKKRAKNRKGIDSRDPREAVTAMFPYAVRWLKGYGVDQKDPSFASMEDEIRSAFSDDYAALFLEMYDLWREAAYSEHEISERSRLSMEAFTNDTVKSVKAKCRLKDRLRLKLRHAL